MDFDMNIVKCISYPDNSRGGAISYEYFKCILYPENWR